ncbi:MAG: protoporphyrinogen/coproporphyrinogen oxidase [Oceanococcus sp.]
MKQRKVAVIGAGVSGAMSARLLRQAGCEVQVFEREAEPGGRAISWRDPERDLVLDSGAAFFTSFYSRLIGLLPELGLEHAVHRLSRQLDFVAPSGISRFNAGSIWSSAWSSLMLPTLGLRDKWRLAVYLARINAQRKRWDWVDPASLTALDDRSVADDAIQQVGENAYHAFIRQTIEPFWFLPAEHISRAMFISMMSHSAGAGFFSFPGGIDQFTRALLDKIDTHFSAEALAIEQDGVGMTLRWRDADGVHAQVFDSVVCATTARIASKLCADLPETRYSKAQHQFLTEQPYCANLHVAYLIDSKESHPVSLAVPAGPGERDIVAVGLCGERYPKLRAQGKEIVSLYFSPKASLRYVGQSESEIYQQAWALARAFYPRLPADAEPLHCALREDAIPEFGVGHYQRIVNFQKLQRTELAFAGDYLAGACIEGALASAERAVAVVLAG